MVTVHELLWPRLQGMRNRFSRSSRAEKLTASFFLLFGLVFWIGISSMFGWFIQEFYAIEIVGPIVLRKLMELLLMSLFALLCFSNVVTALSTFYLSDDLELLLSLPISRVTLFVSRLTETMAQSSWMALAFGLPVLAAYGITYGAGPTYYALICLILPVFLVIPASTDLPAGYPTDAADTSGFADPFHPDVRISRSASCLVFFLCLNLAFM